MQINNADKRKKSSNLRHCTMGVSNSTATLFATFAVGLIIPGTNFLFTLVALKYIDIVGRRKFLI